VGPVPQGLQTSSMVKAGLLALLIACTPKSGGGSDASFRVFYPDAPSAGFQAVVGKRFAIKPVGQCSYEDGRDARWAMTAARIDDGELPPGLSIEDGTIAGTPKQPGSWTVRVRFAGITCAAKSIEPQLVNVMITVGAR
jgi:hypothetical protein